MFSFLLCCCWRLFILVAQKKRTNENEKKQKKNLKSSWTTKWDTEAIYTAMKVWAEQFDQLKLLTFGFSFQQHQQKNPTKKLKAKCCGMGVLKRTNNNI